MIEHKFHLVTPKDALWIWPEIEPLINKGLEHSSGEAEAEAFFLPIYQGQQQLWVGLDGTKGPIPTVLITEVLRFPIKTAMYVHVWATRSGYDYDPWVKAFEAVKDSARTNGCEYIEARARKGLAKKLVTRDGWTEKQTVITTEL
tara:strand:- start:51 stop:485 length:435 start_codon:yes stop_codon:yes gene_type:complete